MSASDSIDKLIPLESAKKYLTVCAGQRDPKRLEELTKDELITQLAGAIEILSVLNSYLNVSSSLTTDYLSGRLSEASRNVVQQAIDSY